MVKTDRIIAQLDLHEGRRAFPYADTVGKLTIGVGHNLTDNGLSDAAIDFILNEDIEIHWKELIAKLPWVEQLDEVRQRVLLDMAFNLGVPGLLSFKNTLAAVSVETTPGRLWVCWRPSGRSRSVDGRTVSRG